MAASTETISSSSAQGKKPSPRHTARCKHDGCGAWAWAQGYCDPHYQKLKRIGVIQKRRVMKDDVARFHTKYTVNPVTGCWEWTGAIHPRGYPLFGVTVDGKPRSWRANRFSYENFVGPIPPGMKVLHECDNRRCVRPQCLFLGTDKDNMQDCVAKGRHCSQTGKNLPKITSAMVLNIRIMYARGLPAAYGNKPNPTSMQNLADIYDVEHATISGILKGRSHLDD